MMLVATTLDSTGVDYPIKFSLCSAQETEAQRRSPWRSSKVIHWSSQQHIKTQSYYGVLVHKQSTCEGVLLSGMFIHPINKA